MSSSADARTPDRIFFFSARTQYSNAGDALINRELLRLVRAYGRVRAIAADAPPAFRLEIGLDDGELIAGGLRGLVSEIVRVLLAGQEVYLLQTPGGMRGGTVRLREVVRALGMPFLALVGIRAVRVGVSVGDLPPGRARLLAWQSRFMRLLGLRDVRSRSSAAKAGCRNVAPFPDLALQLQACVAPRAAQDSVDVALAFRDDRMTPADREALVEALHSALSGTAIGSLSIVVQVSSDRTFANVLEARLAQWRPRLVQSLSIEALMGHYAGVHIVLSNRLHALFMAGLSGAAPIPLVDPGRDGKVLGAFEEMGLADLATSVDALPDLRRAAIEAPAISGRFVEAADRARLEITSTFERLALRANGAAG